jgi:hypothetical protein
MAQQAERAYASVMHKQEPLERYIGLAATSTSMRTASSRPSPTCAG